MQFFSPSFVLSAVPEQEIVVWLRLAVIIIMIHDHSHLDYAFVIINIISLNYPILQSENLRSPDQTSPELLIQ